MNEAVFLLPRDRPWGVTW